MNMKKLFYTMLVVACIMAACTGSNGFRNYIGSVRGLTQRVDTISSPASYVAFIDTIKACNAGFTELSIELDDEQTKQLAGAADSLQQALNAKYAQLTAAAAPAPDSDADTEVPVH